MSEPCGGGPYGAHRTEPCPEEPFLHVLIDQAGETVATLCCTQHVNVIKYLRVVEFNGRKQVHEVAPACLDSESIWDVEENCCVHEEDEEMPVLTKAQERSIHPFR